MDAHASRRASRKWGHNPKGSAPIPPKVREMNWGLLFEPLTSENPNLFLVGVTAYEPFAMHTTRVTLHEKTVYL